MHMTPAGIPGAWLIDYEPVSDERGWFMRVYDADVFAQAGLCTDYPQHGEAHNRTRGTVRGLHFQSEPHAEVRLIRCTHGAVYDVLVDLRPGANFGAWRAFELRAGVPRALYAPAGVAHGYQTLEDETRLHYQISARYAPAAAAGVAFDSAALAIPWPLPVSVISARDRALAPLLTDRP
jgi:dTDP-4-dehydrorhamnose 3,5-epimerase